MRSPYIEAFTVVLPRLETVEVFLQKTLSIDQTQTQVSIFFLPE